MISPAVSGLGFNLGTAACMSPEQAKGRAADSRSDIWSFGVVVLAAEAVGSSPCGRIGTGADSSCRCKSLVSLPTR